MSLRLTERHLDAIRTHGARDYPNECCGILLGSANGETKEVKEVVALKNIRSDPALAQKFVPLEDPGRETERNRYLIDPAEQLRIEKGARARGLEVLGYYHSHPDHPARPSDYDREHAWPWYSYIIVAVERGTPKALVSWVLSDDRSRFDLESIEGP